MNKPKISSPPTSEKIEKIALVGNPNVGKSVIFGWLTGKYVTVSNYPGTTVEVTQGNIRLEGKKGVLVDTPGTNSLIPMSEDERVTRDILLEEGDLKVLQVGDAKNLRRALGITLQLAEMEKPVVLVLNMADEAQERGIAIDREQLSAALGIPVFSTIATRCKGLEGLTKSLNEDRIPHLFFPYSSEVEESIQAVSELLPPKQTGRRALALMILSGDESLQDWIHARLDQQAIRTLDEIRLRLQKKLPEPVGFWINRKRLQAVDQILAKVFRKSNPVGGRSFRLLNTLTTHPVAGIPILLLVLYAMYKFVGDLGAGVAVDFMQQEVFGRWINPAAARGVKNLTLWKPLEEFLVGPYGMIPMGLTYALAIVMPIVATFFLAFGFLEDSGYLPRLAIMANRIFRVMGLNGKAVLPMVLGLGCGTMATLTARMLETKKERILVTLLLALGIPCSAQIGVMVGMFAGISFIAVLIWMGVIAGSMILVGLLANQVLPGEKADFILEIPPLRVPTLKNLLVKTLARMEWFLWEAVPLFLFGTAFLFALDQLGFLEVLQKWAEPIVTGFLGLPVKATEAFLLGFLRRDYGAAGLFVLAQEGKLDGTQIVVSLATLTLFIPCLANFFMIIKERGWWQALAMAGFIFPFAILVGGGLNYLLRAWGVSL
ncbi:MAG: ferrous iron transport protein B [Deltaproteobacteria bacterium]|nr:MAG: ferrous iron transport protein B [Deltaproteobacteria bacterium]